MSEKYEVTIFNFFPDLLHCSGNACDQYLNFIPHHTKITNRRAECRLKIHTEMCLWKDAFIAIETYKFDYSLFSFEATSSNILKFGMTDK